MSRKFSVAVFSSLMLCFGADPLSRSSTAWAASPDGCGSEFVEAVVFLRLSAHPVCPPAINVHGVPLKTDYLFGAESLGRLRHFCRVSLENPSDAWPLLSDVLAQIPNGESIGPNFAALSGQGQLEDAVSAERRVAFHHRAGTANLSILPPPAKIPTIAMIDSAPTSDHPTWTQSYPHPADHGLTLARIAEELICVDGDPNNAYNGQCWGQVRPHQALRFGSSFKPGRTHGSLGDLAAAIHDAALAAPEGIINISIAWSNPCMGGERGDITASETPAAAAVHEALQYARCQDMAIFAAAGNELGTIGSRYEAGMMYPAQWAESFDAPSPTQCSHEFSVSGAHAGSLRLVTAVGGVHDAMPLALARPDGEPRLVAEGHNGVALLKPSDPLQTTLLLSGTSVSTMVVSAATAIAAAATAMPPIQLETICTG
ncbi:MAG: S8 family serine peptidase [Myxococcota bacterium]